MIFIVISVLILVQIQKLRQTNLYTRAIDKILAISSCQHVASSQKCHCMIILMR